MEQKIQLSPNLQKHSAGALCHSLYIFSHSWKNKRIYLTRYNIMGVNFNFWPTLQLSANGLNHILFQIMCKSITTDGCVATLSPVPDTVSESANRPMKRGTAGSKDPLAVGNNGNTSVTFGGGGGRGSSVGRARDSWRGGPGFDPRCGRPLPLGWVDVSLMWPAETEGIPALSRVWQHAKLSDVSLGTRPRCSLVVDEDVKKPTKSNQT